MKDKVYHLKIHSISRFLISMMTIFLTSIFLLVDKLPRIDNEIISIIQFLAVFVTSFYLANLIGMGKVKVLLNEEGLVHIWERRFFLSWEKNYIIPWNMVDNYVFEEDRTFDSFIINLTNKTRYKISRQNILPIKDDFEKLVKNFPKLSNEYKNGLTSPETTTAIKKGESMYASKSFKWAFYFFSLGFLILVLTKLFNTNSQTTWSSLSVIGSGLLFYGLMINRQRNNN